MWETVRQPQMELHPTTSKPCRATLITQNASGYVFQFALKPDLHLIDKSRLSENSVLC